MAKNDNAVKWFDKYVSVFSGQPEYDFAKKDFCTRQHIKYMFARTQSMFRWENLPETIPVRSLELYLQMNGNCCFYRYDGKLYVFTGGMGGEPNVYYMPTIYTIANPALKLSVNAIIDKDCVVMPNDSLYIGLSPLFARYASAMTETELSIKLATINTRIINLLSAPDDRTKVSAEKYLKDVSDGKLGVIAENAFLEGIRSQPYGNTGNTNTLTNLIELEQYFKASWFNEIGLNANYNMKRESINAGESQLNNDALLPLVDDMLNCRKTAVEKVNDMFGTDIVVSLSSSWEDNLIEIENEQNETGGGETENNESEKIE